jgi:hypothetical protein
MLHQFVEEKIHVCNGHEITMEEFYVRFQVWLDSRNPKMKGYWNKKRIQLNFFENDQLILGKIENRLAIGNASWTIEEPLNYKWAKGTIHPKKVFEGEENGN